MKNTLATTEITMSSLDFLNDYINPAREEAGESIITKQSFLKKVESELKGELGVVQKNITEEINNLGFFLFRVLRSWSHCGHIRSLFLPMYSLSATITAKRCGLICFAPSLIKFAAILASNKWDISLYRGPRCQNTKN